MKFVPPVKEEIPPDEIVLPAKREHLPEMIEFVKKHVWESGFSDKKIEEIALATSEAIENILRFVVFDGEGMIRITSTTHDSGTLIITISDNGRPFNMLLESTFPEIYGDKPADEIPSTKLMKRAIKNIEYIRGADKNTLVFTISPLLEETGRGRT